MIWKIYESREKNSLSFTKIKIFSTKISNSFDFTVSFKVILINMVSILTMSTKLASQEYLNKGYYVISFVHDFINKKLSRD